MTLKAGTRLGSPGGLRTSRTSRGRTARRLFFPLAGFPDPLFHRDGQVSAHTASLSSPAPAARAQLELHVPRGLTRLQVVEGAEVVLPAWYSFRGEVSSGQPPEMLTVMWFLEQEGKELNQVREEGI